MAVARRQYKGYIVTESEVDIGREVWGGGKWVQWIQEGGLWVQWVWGGGICDNVISAFPRPSTHPLVACFSVM